MQQSGLTRTRLAHQGQHFAMIDVEIEVFEHHKVTGARPIGFGDSTRAYVVLWHLRLTITHRSGLSAAGMGEEPADCGINAVRIINPPPNGVLVRLNTDLFLRSRWGSH